MADGSDAGQSGPVPGQNVRGSAQTPIDVPRGRRSRMNAQPQSSPLIAGSVLPIKRAEELLSTLPGVMAARIIAGSTGAVEEIHVVTSSDVTAKQTVRNIESALIAQLGMRVDHRKISVATTMDGRRASASPRPAGPVVVPDDASAVPGSTEVVSPVESEGVAAGAAGVGVGESSGGRAYIFEDVEVSRSRRKGLSCRVTLTKDGESFTGEAEGSESERTRVELAARAALRAIGLGEPSMRLIDLSGARVVEAFDREFVFVGVMMPQARSSVLLTGSCEVKDSAETASVLAVLDATNRWLGRRAGGAVA